MPKKPPQDKPKRLALGPGSGIRGRKISSVSDLLSSQPAARAAQAALAAERAWLAFLRPRLPPEIAGHLAGAAVRRGVLLIYATSAAWSARLRYVLGGLEPQCTEHDPTVRRIEVRVQPPGSGGRPRR